MIRRDFQLENGAPAWLLVSQCEHARISGELARAWDEKFSDEVVAGIAHHDDGWLEWEAAPQLDQHGRPRSFMELDIADALAIWHRSIAAARSFGPLAGAIVAGHFIGLARGSEQAVELAAEEWLHDMSNRRDAWLAEWRRASPSNTLSVADWAQQMLLVADLLSLWLCCGGPVNNKDDSTHENTEMRDRTATILGKYRFTTRDQPAGSCISQHDTLNRTGHDPEIVWDGSLGPWPLSADSLRLATPAMSVRVANYRSWQEIADASRPVRLVWHLRKTLLPTAEC